MTDPDAIKRYIAQSDYDFDIDSDIDIFNPESSKVQNEQDVKNKLSKVMNVAKSKSKSSIQLKGFESALNVTKRELIDPKMDELRNNYSNELKRRLSRFKIPPQRVLKNVEEDLDLTKIDLTSSSKQEVKDFINQKRETENQIGLNQLKDSQFYDPKTQTVKANKGNLRAFNLSEDLIDELQGGKRI